MAEDKKENKKKGVPNPKILPEQWEQLIEEVSSGMTNVDACILSGISESTLYERTKNDLEYSDRLKQAVIQFKQEHIKYISKDKSWQARAWVLEKKFNKEFGKIERIETKEVTDFSGNATDDLEEELRKLDSRGDD